MDKPESVLFYDLCRLCLENTGVNYIFTKTNLPSNIFLCTGVHVDSQDNFPQKICFKCLEIVENANRLRVLATANEELINSMFDDDEKFTLSFNTIAQNQKKGDSFSRSSSTDSDRTVKLDTLEKCDHFKQEVESPKRDISDSLEYMGSEQKKTVSVRTDLFASSGNAGTETSSTRDVNTLPKKQNIKVKIKRVKTGTADSFYYVCDQCHKKFSEWKKFYLHQKTHNRNITCSLNSCGKKFATKGDLEKHVRTHTGERPFSCDLCEKRFAQRVSLKSHRLNVHAKLGTPEKRKRKNNFMRERKVLSQ